MGALGLLLKELVAPSLVLVLPSGLGTQNSKDPSGIERLWLVAPAVPRLVFDLSHSTFPFCCTWPNRHKENVIIGAGSVITKETKQTSCALPEHNPNSLLLQAGEEGTEGAASPPCLAEAGARTAGELAASSMEQHRNHTGERC